MKIAAICEAIEDNNRHAEVASIEHVLVHTGQHYEAKRSTFFFNDLALPKPNLFLGASSGSHPVQTARIMGGFERVLGSENPDIVVVVGDADSALACAIVTKKTRCSRADGNQFIPKLAHLEAGLRSLDRSMPNELNRIVTDTISDYLFTTEESANQNLEREGFAKSKIHLVGNVMIDNLLRYRARVGESKILTELQLCEDDRVKPYAVLTLHCSTSVNIRQKLAAILESFMEVSQHMPIIFPAHPRVIKQIEEADLADYFVDHYIEGPEPWDSRVRIRLVSPLGYLDFLRLMSQAKVMITDSGSIQEETTILGVPCMTLLENTERPATIRHGTSVLVGTSPEKIVTEFNRLLRGVQTTSKPPHFCDGNAANRIVQILSRKQMCVGIPGALARGDSTLGERR